MEQRLSLITLGVADLARARAFYEAMGWTASPASQPTIVFFQLNGMALALWPRHELAADCGVSDSPPGFGGIALAWNGRDEAAVDAVMARAAAAGAQITRPAGKTFWGGYSGVFLDLDGHPWEVAHNPFFPLDAAGNLSLGG